MSHGTSLETAQEIMRAIQRVASRFEGSINKISQDDKGVMIDVAFGLPPLAHSDDPVRGIQAALLLRDQLNALGMRGSIGLATGRVFCGSVGTDDRREYTFLGNSVNLAARLMSLALEHIEFMARDGIAIFCDRATYEASKERAEFDVLAPQKVKGRNEPVDVFHPVAAHRNAADVDLPCGATLDHWLPWLVFKINYPVFVGGVASPPLLWYGPAKIFPPVVPSGPERSSLRRTPRTPAM